MPSSKKIAYCEKNWGFGFDPVTADYRVVVFVAYRDLTDESISKSFANYSLSVLIYSLSNDSWKYFADLSKRYYSRRNSSYTLVNTSFYWLGSESSDHVLTFTYDVIVVVDFVILVSALTMKKTEDQKEITRFCSDVVREPLSRKLFRYDRGGDQQIIVWKTGSRVGACSNVNGLQFGKQVHGFAVKIGLQTETMAGTALVDMYAKCGSCMSYHVFREMNGNCSLITWNSVIAGLLSTNDSDTALELFSELESEGLVPDSATWNTMISGLSRCGNCAKVFQLFTMTVSSGILPNLKLLTSVLVVCSISLSLQRGKEIHAQDIKADIGNDEFFVTSLIDLYMKCGQPIQARTIFDKLDIKPVKAPIWNAMISGYGRNGDDESAFEIFNLMQEMNVELNSTTFTTVLWVKLIKDYGYSK
ncbi:hypothetical protein RND81_11G033100 [Saponaria officinalis]|uniref:Pentatricopeptide repeat-containing protein n=1 Tax=Saponaria officinalis TaxID=3572 RepID=A0AAW1HJ31_SAPOF